MRFFILLICCCPLFVLKGQTIYKHTGLYRISDYDWDNNPDAHWMSTQTTDKDATILKDYRRISYTISENKKKVEIYYTKNFLIHINSGQALEKYKTTALPLHNVKRIINIKARTIGADYYIKNLDRENDFKEIANYENNGPFLIFAMQGLEIGSYIEYVYTFEINISQQGTEYFPNQYPVNEATLEIYIPKQLANISFLKSNADFEETDRGIDFGPKFDHYKFRASLPERKVEPYAANNAALPRIEYCLYKKTEKSLNNSNWTNIAEDLWKNLTTFSIADMRACKKTNKKILAHTASTNDKIIAIENFLKQNIQLESNPKTGAMNSPAKILSCKTASLVGLIRTYILMCHSAGINCNIVGTTDRFAKTFDPKFVSSGLLNEFALYFPETDKYLSPAAYHMRYGFIPDELICQEGLFIGSLFIDGQATYVVTSEIKPVICFGWDQNQNNITATVHFDFDLGVANVNYQHTYTGLEAASVLEYKLTTSGEKEQNDLINNILKEYSGKNEPKNVIITGSQFNDLGKNPLVMKMDYTSEQLLERVGTKYIFHIGELIGTHQELYNDTLPRVNGIENTHNRGYLHKLIVEIPEGYKITNPDAVIFNVTHGADNNEITQFKSSYKMEGNKMIIDIKETYGTIRYPKEDYEPFRKVINAAADFNKVVLYLEKQK